MAVTENASAVPVPSPTGMTPAVLAVLAELEAVGPAHDRAEAEHARRLLNLERSTAEVLFLLLRATGRRRVLEVGTSNGVSALWIASALHDLPDAAPLVTLERDPDRHTQAVRNLAHAGLSERARPLLGDATALVATLPGPFDCVFFDADRLSAPAQLALLLPRLLPDCLLLADNALSHPGDLAPYVAAVGHLPGFAALTLPVGKGLHVAHRRG